MTSRFVVVLLVLVPALGALAWTGAVGLSSTHRTNDRLYHDIIATEHASTQMVAAMDDVHLAALAALAVGPADPSAARAFTTRLVNSLIPRVDATMTAVVSLHENDEADEKQTIADLGSRWRSVRALVNAMAVELPEPRAGTAQMNAAFDHLNEIARSLISRAVRDGRLEYAASAAPYHHKLRIIFLLLAGALASSVAALVWLYRAVLPRARRYSAFATKVAEGDFDDHLESRGNDDLAVLGRSLEEMATRRKRERDYDRSQVQFAESMQLSENEDEAHRMLKRHLERAIPDSGVVILNRNNSRDRLEAVTEVPEGSPLRTTLAGALPRSCVAVRQARTHEHNQGDDALLRCPVCADCPGRSTCTPFLVGGEVIGSVLITSPQPLDEQETRRMRDCVVQAAPVMANLRNLAIAETRAATDSLTGLPNRRSIDANLMRMVAHAGRTAESIALLLLDLDHFKHVNDRHGHGAGDEVLAAFGAALRATIRESDFAGRFGGEEFLVVLPNTTLDGAVQVAELIRRTVSTISVPSVDQTITVSIGAAVLPDHAGDAGGLIRCADRALYLAKRNGRDRVETARTDALGAPAGDDRVEPDAVPDAAR